MKSFKKLILLVGKRQSTDYIISNNVKARLYSLAFLLRDSLLLEGDSFQYNL